MLIYFAEYVSANNIVYNYDYGVSIELGKPDTVLDDESERNIID